MTHRFCERKKNTHTQQAHAQAHAKEHLACLHTHTHTHACGQHTHCKHAQRFARKRTSIMLAFIHTSMPMHVAKHTHAYYILGNRQKRSLRPCNVDPTSPPQPCKTADTEIHTRTYTYNTACFLCTKNHNKGKLVVFMHRSWHLLFEVSGFRTLVCSTVIHSTTVRGHVVVETATTGFHPW